MAENATKGEIQAVKGNLVSVHADGVVLQNEVAHIDAGEGSLKAEVIRVRGNIADLQVFENTRWLKVGDSVRFSGELLSVELGPGLLGHVFDGLQNPLAETAERYGFFIPNGVSLPALDPASEWEFTPTASPGDRVKGGVPFGTVQEGVFTHRIMTPFYFEDEAEVVSVAPADFYSSKDIVATIRDSEGTEHELTMFTRWPVKIPITAYEERLMPLEPLTTEIRIIDTLFPVAKGGTYCSPGPFGAGKTVLQQFTARYARVDVVIMAACGERAGEVVDTLKEFPKLEDPRTGRSLMERTVIICNTSSMPVAAREASVYTAVTIAEYYRQMGLHVLLLADSTSRWAQAMREISGRLEEIPGDEAYPAYLESRIARFYERAGIVKLYDGSLGSVTIGGTVSPAGGTFEEPVTQATIKVVGAFHGLSRERASARRFPSIDPLESWSTYEGFIDREKLRFARHVLKTGREAEQMMKVVGEEGISIADYVIYLKAEFFDFAYLQQNAFDKVDGATRQERQEYVFDFVHGVLEKNFSFEDKPEAMRFFQTLRQACIDWNYEPWDSESFRKAEAKVVRLIGDGAVDETGV